MTTHKYLFHNFTDKSFTGYWNGKAYTFKPGVKKYYSRLIARHFAKHLTNQVLTATGQERMTSPKKPDEVPAFMEIFHKAFISEEVADEDNLDIDSGGKLIEEPSMNINVKPREQINPYDASVNEVKGPVNPAQTIEAPVPKIEASKDQGEDSEEGDYQETDKPKK